MNSHAQASAGITSGHISHGYVDNVWKYLRKAMSKKSKNASGYVSSEQEEEFMPSNRHQAVMLPCTRYRCNTGCHVDQVSWNAEVVDRPHSPSYYSCGWHAWYLSRKVTIVPVGFGRIVMRMKLMVINDLPFDLIIGDLPQVEMRAKM